MVGWGYHSLSNHPTTGWFVLDTFFKRRLEQAFSNGRSIYLLIPLKNCEELYISTSVCISLVFPRRFAVSKRKISAPITPVAAGATGATASRAQFRPNKREEVDSHRSVRHLRRISPASGTSSSLLGRVRHATAARSVGARSRPPRYGRKQELDHVHPASAVRRSSAASTPPWALAGPNCNLYFVCRRVMLL